MYQDFWEFEATHKLFLAANHLPTIRGSDHAIWRRIHLIPFNVRFVLPGQDDGQSDARRADPDLADKLRGELPGILAWLVRGCLDWQRIGLAPPAKVLAATKDYRARMDVVQEFIDDCCTIAAQNTAGIGTLYRAYVSWCETTGHEAEGQRAFSSRLEERGFHRGRTSDTRYWSGIGLRTEGR
jgi:putative DNA primase/helicase